MTETPTKISFIETGGTIAGTKNKETKAIEVSTSSLFDDRWLKSLSKEVEFQQPINLMRLLSEEMNPSDWIKIAKTVAEEANKGAYGIVITHGTYTMPYTAAALSFMLKHLNIPVVLTGSQIPAVEEKTDASSNVRAAVEVAKYKKSPAEVCVVFSGGYDDVVSYFSNSKSANFGFDLDIPIFIYRGTRVRKVHDWKFNCFQSINQKPLGRIVSGHIEFDPTINFDVRKDVASEKTIADTELDHRVMLIKAFSGLSSEFLDMIVDSGKIRGVIIEGFSDGILSTREGSVFSFISSIERAKKEGIPAFATSQTIGETTLQSYKTGEKLRGAGLIPLGDMTIESAVVKLMWALGHSSNYDEITNAMRANIAGEITERH